MDEVTILEQDRIDAENFLQQVLTDSVPDGNFKRGNALFDFAVTAMSSIFAYLKREVDYVKARQSLLLLGALSGADVDRAVDEILSNWFLTRKDGVYSRGTATIHLTDNESFTVPTSMRFYRADGTAFKPDYTSDQAFGAEDMSAVVDPNGIVVSYALRVLVVALETGEVGNVDPGAFTDYSPRSSRIIRIENENKFAQGSDIESTQAFLERSETAVTTRNMVSARSIDATLRDEFSDIDSVVTIGFGDPEMIRDLITEAAVSLRLHIGGNADAFIRSAILEAQQYTAEIGGIFSDPRPGYYVFRDDTIPDFVAAGVVRGDVISVKNALLTEPQNYVIDGVNNYVILVSRRSQFPLAMPEVEEEFANGEVGPTIGNWPIVPLGRTRLYAGTDYTFTSDDIGKFIRVKNSSVGNDGTWEILDINDAPGSGTNYATLGGLTVPTFADESNVDWELCTRHVIYTVGDLPPSYDNKITQRATGRFTKELQNDGRILLPLHPIYKIRNVSFDDPLNVTGYAVGGRVTFLTRVNTTPANPGGNPDNLQYQVICDNYGESQSGWQVMQIRVGWPGADGFFNGYNLRVTYDTIASYPDVWAFMLDVERRQVCGSVIPRGLHPVYISFVVNYKLVRTAIDELDETVAAQALADYINDFPSTEDIDVSDLVAFLRTTYDVLGLVEISAITYNLHAPDGRVIPFSTPDVVEIVASKETGTFTYDRLEDPLSEGVSHNTIRYIVDSADITFNKL